MVKKLPDFEETKKLLAAAKKKPYVDIGDMRVWGEVKPPIVRKDGTEVDRENDVSAVDWKETPQRKFRNMAYHDLLEAEQTALLKRVNTLWGPGSVKGDTSAGDESSEFGDKTTLRWYPEMLKKVVSELVRAKCEFWVLDIDVMGRATEGGCIAKLIMQEKPFFTVDADGTVDGKATAVLARLFLNAGILREMREERGLPQMEPHTAKTMLEDLLQLMRYEGLSPLRFGLQIKQLVDMYEYGVHAGRNEAPVSGS